MKVCAYAFAKLLIFKLYYAVKDINLIPANSFYAKTGIRLQISTNIPVMTFGQISTITKLSITTS